MGFLDQPGFLCVMGDRHGLVEGGWCVVRLPDGDFVKCHEAYRPPEFTPFYKKTKMCVPSATFVWPVQV